MLLQKCEQLNILYFINYLSTSYLVVYLPHRLCMWLHIKRMGPFLRGYGQLKQSFSLVPYG